TCGVRVRRRSAGRCQARRRSRGRGPEGRRERAWRPWRRTIAPARLNRGRSPRLQPRPARPQCAPPAPPGSFAMSSTDRPVSLSRFLIEEQRQHRHINADLRLLIEVVGRACKAISHAVGRGALGNVLGNAGAVNVQGEAQKKLDVLSNEILLEANEWGGHLAALAS